MMATRQQRVVAPKRPRQSIRTTYEDFEPPFELMEEHDAHIIRIQLPGFEEEQVKFTSVQAPGVIKVHGQRPLGNNIWSRFNQTFPLPQNCHESKIRGEFRSGLFTLTFPKEGPYKEAEAEAKAATKPTQDAMLKTTSAADKDEDHLHYPTSSEKPDVQPKLPKVDDPVIHQTTIPAAAAAKDPLLAAAEPEAQTGPRSIEIVKTHEHKDNEAGFISATTQNEKQIDVKRVISLTNTVSQSKPQNDSDEITPKAMEDENTNTNNQKSAEKVVDMLQSKGKEMITHGSYNVADVIDRIAPNTNLDQVKKKSKYFGKETQGEMKNLDKWINDEEKQLLVNVGVAVLVLAVLLGGILWRRGKAKN